MKTILLKKINLLLHLAKVDGRFDKSEEILLRELLKENGLDGSYLDAHQQDYDGAGWVSGIPDKAELFYWILKLIKADQYLHPEELALSKDLAVKLGIKPEAVDFFSNRNMPPLGDFDSLIKSFQIQEG